MTEQYKSGNEFLPFHPQASHVSPDYRDGWNACWQAAIASREPMTEEQIAEQLTDSDAPLSFVRGIRLAERFHGIGE